LKRSNDPEDTPLAELLKDRKDEPEWFLNKYGHLSTTELRHFARSSEENRRQLRDDDQRRHNWYVANAPNGFVKRLKIYLVESQIRKGRDPHDHWYRDPTDSTWYKVLYIIVAILKFALSIVLIYRMFNDLDGLVE
jgi:hypothetical protein